ncbi:MAG TPA: PQQ-dependent sugar dehydrogenase [Ferruginibacter sp.]|nr:PQQ-dependent sugar dehydrogenase [Ferruginibacter sp.]HMP19517.1 PQQ-dependent sugar dehydrogenase [Ferruginibacter sp.]
MKNILLLLHIYLFMCCTIPALAQGETFAPKRIVNANTAAGRFRHPFAMTMGPSDSLWVTERRGYITRIHTISGEKKQLLQLTGKVKFTTSGSGASMSIAQDGMLGIALHPELGKGTGHDFVYTAYCYDSSGIRRVRIVRFEYTKLPVPPFTDTLLHETVLLSGIPGSNDHNSGRLIIGNYGTAVMPDFKIVYTVGDQGANQFSNACDSIEAQYLPTAGQLAAGNLRRYSGKILRLNLDGSIPADNPFFEGVQSHVWSYGHRNPQGLCIERNSSNEIVPNGRLYSSEQGPACDDEINIIDSANNYGWPRISGLRDGVWYKYYQWSASGSCGSYPGECSATMTNFGLDEFSFNHPRLTAPIFDLYPGIPPGGTSCNWLSNPTVAPSSIAFYPFVNKIPGWQNSLLITTLKSSAMYRLKLNAAGNGALSVSDSVVQYFRDETALNRFRDIVVSNDGLSFFILTDSVGATSGPSGSGVSVTDRGSVLEYKYTGTVLALNDNTPPQRNRVNTLKIYPNPANDVVLVDCRLDEGLPVQYIIYETSGRIVLKGSSIKNNFSIPLHTLNSGVYILQLINKAGKNIATQKIVVSRVK